MEVKIRLPDAAAHAKVAALLCDSQQEVHAQENYFFDGSEQELGQQRVVLRLRFYNKDRKAVVTLKVGAAQGAVLVPGQSSLVAAPVESLRCWSAGSFLASTWMHCMHQAACLLSADMFCARYCYMCGTAVCMPSIRRLLHAHHQHRRCRCRASRSWWTA